jgi:hypothetical protein
MGTKATALAIAPLDLACYSDSVSSASMRARIESSTNLSLDSERVRSRRGVHGPRWVSIVTPRSCVLWIQPHDLMAKSGSGRELPTAHHDSKSPAKLEGQVTRLPASS